MRSAIIVWVLALGTVAATWFSVKTSLAWRFSREIMTIQHEAGGLDHERKRLEVELLALERQRREERHRRELLALQPLAQAWTERVTLLQDKLAKARPADSRQRLRQELDQARTALDCIDVGYRFAPSPPPSKQ